MGKLKTQIAWICLYGVLLGAWLTAEHPAAVADEAADAPRLERVIERYQALALQAQNMQARIRMQYIPLHKSRFHDGLKPMIESLYSVPIHDPMYQHFPLFMKSLATLEWDVILNRSIMSGVQETLACDVYLSTRSFLANGHDALKRKLQIKPAAQFETRFVFNANNGTHDMERLRLHVPEALAMWHFLPNLWYPPLTKIGLRESRVEVKCRGGKRHPYSLLFEPERLDEGLMDLLKRIADDPQLDKSQLRCLLTLDPSTYACRSFDISLHQGEERQYLFKIHHIFSEERPRELPIPQSSSISLIARMQNGSKAHWKMMYSGQFDFQSIHPLDR